MVGPTTSPPFELGRVHEALPAVRVDALVRPHAVGQTVLAELLVAVENLTATRMFAHVLRHRGAGSILCTIHSIRFVSFRFVSFFDSFRFPFRFVSFRFIRSTLEVTGFSTEVCTSD